NRLIPAEWLEEQIDRVADSGRDGREAAAAISGDLRFDLATDQDALPHHPGFEVHTDRLAERDPRFAEGGIRLRDLLADPHRSTRHCGEAQNRHKRKK